MKKAIIPVFIVIFAAVIRMFCYVKFALPNVGAAPEITVESMPDCIRRGEYPANHVAACTGTADLEAIYSYLHSLNPVKNTVVKYTKK